jgi:hypothetical protein
MLFASAKRTHFEIPIHWYGQIGGELTTRERGLASGSRPAPPPRTKSPAVGGSISRSRPRAPISIRALPIIHFA